MATPGQDNETNNGQPVGDSITLMAGEGLFLMVEPSFIGTDTIPPQIIKSPDDQSVVINRNCEFTVPDFTSHLIATDNEDSPYDLQVTQKPEPFTTVLPGKYDITLKVEDVSGNFSETIFQFEVEDNIFPVISCRNDTTINLEQGQLYYTVGPNIMSPLSTYDNCEIAQVFNSYNLSPSLAEENIPPGTHAIEWIIIDNSGNEARCSFNLTIDDFVGLAKNNRKAISFYPNPVEDYLYLDLDTSDINEFVIVDVLGQVIISKKYSEPAAQVNVSKLTPGVYLLKIRSDSDYFTSILIKE
jgi:hypothetical protein